MTDQENEKYAIILGALLHDIGKFERRALESTRIKHEDYSLEFFRDCIKSNALFLNQHDLNDMIERYIDHHEVYHLISSADWISSSERISSDSDSERYPLIPVMQHIDIGKKLNSQKYYYEAHALETAINFSKELQIIDNSKSEKNKEFFEGLTVKLKDLYKNFKEDTKKINANSIKSYCDTFYSILEKYTCRISSASYKSVADISLFDHSRSVAAIALAKHFADNKDKPFMLVHGDISGIQNFIYKISSGDSSASKNTAKRLRGRSFYINLLTETIVSYIIDSLNLFVANVLYSGGGNFIILAQNSNEANNKIIEIEKEVNDYLFKKFKGDLGVVISRSVFDTTVISNYSESIEKIMKINNEQKSKKFFSILDNIFDITIPEIKDTLDVCPICQSDEEKNYIKTHDGLCRNCYEHFVIGRDLLKSTKLVKIKSQLLSQDLIIDYNIICFERLGYYWALCDDKKVKKLIDNLSKEKVDEISIIEINDTDILKDRDFKSTFNISYSFKFIGNYAPTDKDNDILEFEKLASLDTEKYPLMGVLRMDVDNLGIIFQKGFKEYKTMSRISTLSREFNLFFLGYINELAKEHKIYIAYSGGDDVFVVGSWINIIEFAIDLRKDFSRFTCFNPNFTISGGITFCKDKFPIGKAAELAGLAEKEAKSYKKEDKNKETQEKNAISLFGKCIQWEKLYEILSYAKELYEYLMEEEKGSKSLSRSFVYQVYELSKTFEDEKGFSMDKFTAALAKLHYLIARRDVTAQKITNEPYDKKVILFQKLLNPEIQKYFKIIGSYILLKTRNN
ncbi:MAG TPA: type III-A CRISPR-associated protein Cas10/Csm1 [Ignavibacteria bacterium]